MKMTDKNANKIGYKKTKLGWIPEDWEVVRLKDIVVYSQSGLSRKLSNNDIGLPVIRSNNIKNNTIDFSEIKYWYRNDPQGANTQNYVLQNNDILLNFINSLAQIGKCAIFINSLNRDTIFTTNIMRLKLNPTKITPYFYILQTLNERYLYYIGSIAKPAVNQASFTSNDYKMYKISLPPITEQEKIAEVLSCWDNGIEILEKLLEKKQLHKKALMQRLYSRKKTKFDKKIYKLGQLFTNRKETNCTNLELLSVCDGVGIIPRSQLNAKDNSNEDKSKYLKVCIGDIAYNTMRMWQGRCGVSNYLGIVSPAYTVCIPTEKINVNYMYYMFKTPHMIHDFWRFSQGIVEDTLNLKFNNFSIIKVEIPSKEVQQKIAEILNNCDEEIRLLDKKLEMLKLQKKGLMQKLLTGKIRVKV